MALDFILKLPKPLAIKYTERLRKIEEEYKMPYVTSTERMAIKRGQLENAREAVLDVLNARFKNVPYELKEKINYCESLTKLKRLLRKAATARSVSGLKV